ncbi:GNAT family N-acetyltransferase [Paenibacillus sp. MMS20-IR301]|uniref:GNAT family N-acetyltransferase n=1 Tax=Paenibacillus sp. MMS20-IR301 TaxID=2895946 RepID=UPI0028EA870F|nr:GNAT family N-acetyltransferase [Paenibacillus sp. MMS20-IR301]WNS46929.1 GNAT family N-acetyltransferase [Paenibacillus sp. MMS20-IR301]
MEIRPYTPEDEQGWVRCRTLAFLDTAYYDNVLREKERYDYPAIELVAVADGQIIGLLDIEYETEERTVCSRGTGLGGMLWHIAVHPDYRRQGTGNQLLAAAEVMSREKGLNRLEAWTRDDLWVRNWYGRNQFIQADSYLHVYLEGDEEIEGTISSNLPRLRPVYTFAHYTGPDREAVRSRFKRVHECICYEKYFS